MQTASTSFSHESTTVDDSTTPPAAASASALSSVEDSSGLTYIFRPISFEGGSEGRESSGSSVIDSAYGSEILHSKKKCNGFHKKVTATVQNKSLWKTFTKIGNEMIVTKPGRRLFPALMVSMHGLDPDSDYSVSLRVSSADNQRYRYINMKWCATGESEVIQNEDKQIFHHPSSPNSGLFWMKRPISFKTIKVTHYAKSKHGNILLHTMHRYSMEMILHTGDGLQQLILPLPDTTFIAVSAYQNMELTQLKIDNNPFAKGFRYKMRMPASNSISNGGSSMTTAAVQIPAINNSPFTPERSMLAYWQHIHHLQGLATAQPFLPSVTPKPSINGEHSVANMTPGPSASPANLSSIPTLGTNGIPTHFPMFYPNPFVSPYPIQTTSNGTNVTDKI